MSATGDSKLSAGSRHTGVALGQALHPDQVLRQRTGVCVRVLGCTGRVLLERKSGVCSEARYRKQSMSKCGNTLADSGAATTVWNRMAISRRRLLANLLATLLATLLASAVAAGPSLPRGAEDEPGPDGLTEQQLNAALTALQEAVKRGDAEAVAGWVSFPLQVNRNGRSERMGRARFLARYAEVFNGKVRRALAEQEAQALFRNARGAMVGDGELWLAGVCEDRACRSTTVQVVAVDTD